MSREGLYPVIVHIVAYKMINGRMAYVDSPVAVEMLREFPVGDAIMDIVDDKFAELEKGDKE